MTGKRHRINIAGTSPASATSLEIECSNYVEMEELRDEVGRLREAFRLVEPLLQRELHSDEWERIQTLLKKSWSL